MSEPRRRKPLEKFFHVPFAADAEGRFTCLELPGSYLTPLASVRATAGFVALGANPAWIQGVLEPLVARAATGERKAREAVAWLVAKAPSVAFPLRGLAAVPGHDPVSFWARVAYEAKPVRKPESISRLSYLHAALAPKDEDPAFSLHLDEGSWRNTTRSLSEITRRLVEIETPGKKRPPTYSAVEGTISRAEPPRIADVVCVPCAQHKQGAGVEKVDEPVADWTNLQILDIERIKRGTNVVFRASWPVWFEHRAGWHLEGLRGVEGGISFDFSRDEANASQSVEVVAPRSLMSAGKGDGTAGPGLVISSGETASALIAPPALGLVEGQLRPKTRAKAIRRMPALQCPGCDGHTIDKLLENRRSYVCPECGAKSEGARDDDGELYLMIIERGR
jgi:hypothetical protein